MGVASATRTRLTTLAATCLAAGMLIASVAPAAAAPASPTSPTTSVTKTSATKTSATKTSATKTSATKTSAPAHKPAAVAPPAPTNDGPPCSTNADKQYPVICLPTTFGEDQTASAVVGDDIEFFAQVVNNGPARSAATVVITLPEGLELEPDEAVDGEAVYRIDHWYSDDKDGPGGYLACQGGPATITCDVGPLAQHANILIGVDLEVSKDAAPDTTLTFGVALQRSTIDTNVTPYDSTAVSARLRVLLASRLEVGLTPATLHTVVGHRATMTGIVHNAGPGPAPDTFAVALAVDEKHSQDTHFVITNGLGIKDIGSQDGGGSGSESAAASGSAGVPPGGNNGSTVVIVGSSANRLPAQLQRRTLERHAGTPRRNAMPSVRFWPVGTVAAGATTEVVIKLSARTVGTDTMAFGAFSEGSVGDCELDAGSGDGSDSGAPSATELARVPQAAATTSAPSSCPFLVQTKITVIPKPAAALADTGSNRLDAQLGVALWALMLGSLFMWVGRRRRAGGRHG